jgi:catechol 2,3-dioxygenase-like lactoylglutathione lyase family enzyme
MADRFDYLVFTPSDFQRSLRFYQEVLGWQLLDSLEGRSAVGSVILSGGGVRIMLRPAGNGADDAAITLRANPTLHLDIHDVRKRFAQVPEGEHVVTAPTANEFGRLHFVLRDPDGNLVVFNELRQR